MGFKLNKGGLFGALVGFGMIVALSNSLVHLSNFWTRTIWFGIMIAATAAGQLLWARFIGDATDVAQDGGELDGEQRREHGGEAGAAGQVTVDDDGVRQRNLIFPFNRGAFIGGLLASFTTVLVPPRWLDTSDMRVFLGIGFGVVIAGAIIGYQLWDRLIDRPAAARRARQEVSDQ